MRRQGQSTLAGAGEGKAETKAHADVTLGGRPSKPDARPRRLPIDPMQAALELLREGLDAREIAARLHVARSAVDRLAQRLLAIEVQAVRTAAGASPLPIGHTISWGAISQERCPLELLDGK